MMNVTSLEQENWYNVWCRATALYQKGLPAPAIAKELDVSPSVISHSCKSAQARGGDALVSRKSKGRKPYLTAEHSSDCSKC